MQQRNSSTEASASGNRDAVLISVMLLCVFMLPPIAAASPNGFDSVSGLSLDRPHSSTKGRHVAVIDGLELRYDPFTFLDARRPAKKPDEAPRPPVQPNEDSASPPAGSNVGRLLAAAKVALRDGRHTVAVELYKQAAIEGSAEAMFQLGVLHREGKGVARSNEIAIRWYQKAVEQEHAWAMHRLGYMYGEGLGVARAPEIAVRWYRKAAAKGIAISMRNLGNHYQNGTGVPPSKQMALSWYLKAADLGDAKAMFNAAFLLNGYEGVDGDPRRAANLALASLTKLRGRDAKFIVKQLTDHANNWSRQFRRALQERLKQAGIYTGQIDGVMGPGSRRALQRFAEISGSKKDGRRSESVNVAAQPSPAIGQAAPAVGRKRYANPFIGEYRLDWCRKDGRGCGKAAADEFCRFWNMQQATSFTKAEDVGKYGPTREILGGAFCERQNCDGFAEIVCH